VRIKHLLIVGLTIKHVRLPTAVLSAGLQVLLAIVEAASLCTKEVPELEDDPLEVYLHSKAGLYSKATFYWLTSLLRVGYSSPLELEDLGHLPYAESTPRQFHKFNSIYCEEKKSARLRGRNVSLWKCYIRSCWRLFALGGLFKLLGDFVGFVGPLGISIILDYVASLQLPESQKSSPVEGAVLNSQLYYPTWQEFISNGFIMGVIIFLSAIAQGTFSQSSTHLVNVEGIHLKVALQALVYDKALRLCVWTITDHKEGHTDQEEDHCPNGTVNGQFHKKVERMGTKCSATTDVGTITNLMSEDAFNVMQFFWIGHYIWAIPLKIAVLMYLLYLQLGYSAIIGATFCILTMTPLQFVIGKKMSVNSKAVTETSDERLRQTNELLQGMKLLKLYGWEDVYGSRILATRKRELKFLDRDSFYWAVMTFLTHASSVLVTLVTFGMYFVLESEALSASSVFTGLALFNQLTVPLFIFPITVPIIISAMVSTSRLEEYLSLPETSRVVNSEAKQSPLEENIQARESSGNVTKESNGDEPEARRDSVFGLLDIMEDDDEDATETHEESLVPLEDKTDSAVLVQNGCFTWSSDTYKSVITLPTLSVPKGKLTVIVGRVGSGKTSLLSALLGEMHTLTGHVTWAKDVSVAYAAQKPWLLNATLRENILFGQPYRPRRYARVIAACALQPDIDILPGKDLTEIGEKGINLSGGQKQRIAIARAIYSQANIIILDDPLSALDYQVGLQVFEDGIKRLLLRRKRTVILVTHCLQLLSHAHQIVAMEGGQVRAQGTLAHIEAVDRELVQTWQNIMTREQLEEKQGARGHTARERWRLVRLVSRFGVQMKQRSVTHGSWQAEEGGQVGLPEFIPFRKRQGTFSGSRHLTHDLPLPIDECEDEFVGRAERARNCLRRGRSSTTTDPPSHKGILRMSSLQASRNHESTPHPVMRQFSTPSMPHEQLLPNSLSSDGKARIYQFDENPQGSLLRRLLTKDVQRSFSVTGTDIPNNIREKSVLKRLMSTASSKSTASVTISEPECPEHLPIKRLMSSASAFSDDMNDEEETYDESVDAAGGRLTSDEEREYGKIPKKIYLEYLQACGLAAGGSYLLLAISWQGLRVYTDYWLNEWTAGSNSTAHGQVMERHKMLEYFTIYAILSVISIVLSLSSNGIGQYAGARARRMLHNKMLQNILRCPVRFFECTPIGRIINRFSTDMSVIDKKIATSIQRLLQFLLLCVSAVFVNAVVSLWFMLIAFPICALYYVVQRFYRWSSRELQRLDSLTRSPIASHFSETLGGLTTIRAFCDQQRFMHGLFQKMDTHTNVFLIMNAGNRWLGVALDYLGGVIVFVAIVAALISARFSPDSVTPSLVGLAVNYTLLVPIYLNWVVKFLADMEMYMSAVERVHQYALTPTEDYRRDGFVVPKDWPSKGDIVFERVSLRYDAGREPVITNLTLHIPAGQKVGICGRTGCGKSSLVMSLFHMVDVYEGKIYIDNVDINLVPLQVLRSRLSIIPQDVIMFSGTIRENLDPRGQYSDEELWRSLELAQLKEIVSNYPGKLDGEVREGGENLSAGERQLFCLARAILHGAACLVMDEATSSVDPSTEKALLAAASRAFAGRTVITIAHRLTTILNCDRILVLDAGQIVEDGTPSKLLNKSMGVFSSMLRASEEGAIVP
ncbi:ATP-binding cassette sub-family C member Sur, partial [Anabrus simplex]|uniref:ATP-binding cassette sub-family C member Sur n=1 Tax=Anabrus simplex TaxID=316456 RepID=UPI0035A37399